MKYYSDAVEIDWLHLLESSIQRVDNVDLTNLVKPWIGCSKKKKTKELEIKSPNKLKVSSHFEAISLLFERIGYSVSSFITSQKHSIWHFEKLPPYWRFPSNSKAVKLVRENLLSADGQWQKLVWEILAEVRGSTPVSNRLRWRWNELLERQIAAIWFECFCRHELLLLPRLFLQHLRFDFYTLTGNIGI